MGEVVVSNFGFSTLAELKRPYSVKSNRSGTLKSNIDCTIEYVDLNNLKVPIRETILKQIQENNKKLIHKENTKLPSKHRTYEAKLNERDLKWLKNYNIQMKYPFNDNFITRDQCSAHYKKLKEKEQKEKEIANQICNSLKESNKLKFDFCLSRQGSETMSRSGYRDTTATLTRKYSSKTVRSNDTNKYSVNSIEEFPKVLNSVRLTNYLNRKSENEDEFKSSASKSTGLNRFRNENANELAKRIKERLEKVHNNCFNSIGSEKSSIISASNLNNEILNKPIESNSQ